MTSGTHTINRSHQPCVDVEVASKVSFRLGNMSNHPSLTLLFQRMIFFLNSSILSETKNTVLFLPCIDTFS